MRRFQVIILGALIAAADAAAQSTTFSSGTDLVVMQAIVTDRHGAPVSGLPREVFRVFEDGKPQDIGFFLENDAPVSIGLLIDSSGSMFDMRDSVIASAAAFLSALDPRDEFFAFAFNEHVRDVLPAAMPFTSNAALMRERLQHQIGARGRTALHDAIMAGLDRLDRGSTYRKVLIVVGDGGDNASRATFEDVLARAQASNTVMYAVVLSDDANRGEGNKAALSKLTTATGGLTIEPRHARVVAASFKRIGDDIRSGYTLAYTPANVAKDGRFHRTRVTVDAPGGRRVTVRSRPGYVIPVARMEGEGGR